MADKEAAAPSSPESPGGDPRVSISQPESTVSVSFDGKGNTASNEHGESQSQEFGTDGQPLSDDEVNELEAGTEGDPDAGDKAAEGEGDEPDPNAEQPEEEGDKPEDEGDPEGEPEALPEWDAEKEEVVSAFDAKYITKDEAGSEVINFEAFNEEFAKEREDGKRDINPDSRKYLKHRFGISDELIDQHISGVLAQEREAQSIFHTQFASTPEEGKKVYEAMHAWAAGEGGYTAEQKAAFNRAMTSNDHQAIFDQIELLKTRFLTKNPKGLDGVTPSSQQQAQHSGIGLKTRRGVSPSKSATSGATTQPRAAQPFANAEEHRTAQNEALKAPAAERAAKLDEVRKRLQASNFWRG